MSHAENCSSHGGLPFMGDLFCDQCKLMLALFSALRYILW